MNVLGSRISSLLMVTVIGTSSPGDSISMPSTPCAIAQQTLVGSSASSLSSASGRRTVAVATR